MLNGSFMALWHIYNTFVRKGLGSQADMKDMKKKILNFPANKKCLHATRKLKIRYFAFSRLKNTQPVGFLQLIFHENVKIGFQ